MSGKYPMTAEAAFVAALMHLDPTEGAQLHGLMQPSDFESAHLQEIHRLIGVLAHEGVQPHALALYLQAEEENALPTVNHRHVFTKLVTDLYGDPDLVPANARFYATKALGQAVRRRTVEMSTRLAQIADTADDDELERMTQVEQEALRELRDRFHALTGVTTLRRRENAA